MSKRVLIKEDQEVLDSDLNRFGEFSQAALDQATRDGVSNGRHYTGFAVTKQSATKLDVQDGCHYANGVLYRYEAAQVVDVFDALALTSRRKVLVVVGGREIEGDKVLRDFEIVAASPEAPRQVVSRIAPSIMIRVAEVAIIQGAESPDPQVPPTPTDKAAIAIVTMDTNGIVSIEMLTANLLPSANANHQRLKIVENTLAEVLPQISTISSDIAALSQRVKNSADRALVSSLALDVASIKERLAIPEGAVDYGSDDYLDEDKSDTGHVGYSARVEEGLRFPKAASATHALKLLNPVEPRVRKTGNMTLPKWSEVKRLALTNGYAGDRSISQYGTQTVEMRQLGQTRTRIRYGPTVLQITNSKWELSGGTYDPVTKIFKRATGETYFVERTQFGGSYTGPGNKAVPTKWVRLTQFWTDVVEEAYWDRVTTDITTNGAISYQGFLCAQDGYLTSVDIPFTRLDPANSVEVLVCETTSVGTPELQRVLGRIVVPGANVKQYVPETGKGKTNVPFAPIFTAAGRRYAVVVLTAGNYFVGLTSQGSALRGTYGQSTDGVYYQGELGLDMMVDLNYARFEAPRAEIALGWGTDNALVLAGGIMDIDIMADTSVPAQTELIFQVYHNGGWMDLAPTDVAGLATAPGAVQIRMVMVGTQDVMPGICLDNSTCEVSRPATTATHFSTVRMLASSCTLIEEEVVLPPEFDELVHNYTITLIKSGGGVETADSVEEIPSNWGSRRKATFNISPGITQYTVKIVMEATSAANLYYIPERRGLARVA